MKQPEVKVTELSAQVFKVMLTGHCLEKITYEFSQEKADEVAKKMLDEELKRR